MLLHSFSLFFPPDCKPGISHQCVTLKKFPSYQDCLPQSMLYNRLIFYSYYLTVIWIRVIRKGEESTHKSPVEIEWTAGIHLPKSTGGTAAFEAVSATGNSMSPVPPSETSLGAAQQQFAGARPWAELRGLTWEGKQNNLQTCWGKSATLRYLPALPHHGILPCQALGSQLPFTFTLAQELPLWLFSVLLTFWSWREEPLLPSFPTYTEVSSGWDCCTSSQQHVLFTNPSLCCERSSPAGITHQRSTEVTCLMIFLDIPL